MENSEIIDNLVELIKVQDNLIDDLKSKLDDLLKINELLDKKNLYTERLLEIEKNKLPIITLN